MLESEFLWVRKMFFPRWDTDGVWHVTLQRPRGYEVDLDLCDSETKRIHICSCVSGDELRALLIHEITHAVVPHSTMHSGRWQRRMLKAGARAREIARHRLAQMIEHDVEAYKSDVLTVNSALIYGIIEDIAIESREATYDEIVSYVCRYYPMKRSTFNARFKRARAVFEKARSKAAAEHPLGRSAKWDPRDH